MGKGGLNRMLLTSGDLTSPSVAIIQCSDPRAVHIRTILYNPSADSSPSSQISLRIAVEKHFVHDAAVATILPDDSVRVELPTEGRRAIPSPPAVILLLAMQRPKVMQRLLGFVASLGVTGVIVTAADKVEKSYWDCKLFREDEDKVGRGIDENGDAGHSGKEADVILLPGRARGEGKHPERDESEKQSVNLSARRVDGLEAVRQRLAEGVVQGGMDAELPWVVLHRAGLGAVMKDEDERWGLACASRKGWSRVVAHPKAGGQCATEVVRAQGAVVAIGPEGGWTEEEVELMEGNGFQRVTLGERVLRSETAAVVALGLVHEGLRLAAKNGDAEDVKRRRES